VLDVWQATLMRALAGVTLKADRAAAAKVAEARAPPIALSLSRPLRLACSTRPPRAAANGSQSDGLQPSPLPSTPYTRAQKFDLAEAEEEEEAGGSGSGDEGAAASGVESLEYRATAMAAGVVAAAEEAEPAAATGSGGGTKAPRGSVRRARRVASGRTVPPQVGGALQE